MTRLEKGMLIGTGLVVLLIIVLDAIAPKDTDWSESYTSYKRDPYATALMHERLVDLFPQGTTTVHEAIYNTAQGRLGTDAPRANHLFIDRRFDVDDLDLRHLLMMVEQGDDAFIAGETFGSLADTLHVSTELHWEPPDSLTLTKGMEVLMHGDTAIARFTVWPARQQAAYMFARGGMDSMFDRLPMDSTQVLAVNGRGEPVLIRIPVGKGMIYLCSIPRAFTNYYLFKDEGRGFMETALSFLPDRPVLWDEFYKVGRLESPTPLRFILSRKALKAAYWTMIALLGLYLFVYAKRRQRAVPVVEPLKNTSRDFADTMGRLYYAHGDHADLARKMALYFKDELRQKLYLRRSVWDEETVQHIAERTGTGLPEWQHAFRLIDHYERSPHVSEEQILQFNKVLSRLRSTL